MQDKELIIKRLKGFFKNKTLIYALFILVVALVLDLTYTSSDYFRPFVTMANLFLIFIHVRVLRIEDKLNMLLERGEMKL